MQEPTPQEPAPQESAEQAPAEHEPAAQHAAPQENGFAALGLRPELLKALDALGYEEPTPIQRETIPYLMAGKDLLGQAATGTGKTAAFALPALQLINGRAASKPVALVLVPTRELAMQVSEAFFRYGNTLGAKCVPV
ncbi:MAG: DEAD/DEAH box helicase, partial [Actinobacteria bacterium]|nr:DEAD/DEAH box helicase [Actinomycetota bacterium]